MTYKKRDEGRPIGYLIIELDATDDPTHGQQLLLDGLLGDSGGAAGEGR